MATSTPTLDVQTLEFGSSSTPTLNTETLTPGYSDTPTVSQAEVSSALPDSPSLILGEVFGLGPNDPESPDSILTDAQTNPTLVVADPTTYSPYFSSIFRDPDVGDVANKYQIQVSTDSSFSSITHWNSGYPGTSMTNTSKDSRCPDITYSGSPLSEDTFYVRFRFWDDDGNVGNWSTESAYFILEKEETPPGPPDTLWVNGESNPTIQTNDPASETPSFSAIFRDVNPVDIANKYQIQVSTDPTFVVVSHWDTGDLGTSMSDTPVDTRSPDITYAGSVFSYGTFYWRIRFWDFDGTMGEWSTESAYFVLEPYPSYFVRFLGSVRLRGATRVS